MKIVLFLLLFLSLNSYAINYPITPQSIRHQVTQKGWSPVLLEIFNDQSAANMVLLAIDSGEKSWLNLALSILNNSQNKQTHKMVVMSLGEALQWHPRNIFSIIVPSVDVKKICSVEGIYEWRLMSKFLANQAISRRLESLENLKDFKYAKVNLLCQKELIKAKKVIDNTLSNLP